MAFEQLTDTGSYRHSHGDETISPQSSDNDSYDHEVAEHYRNRDEILEEAHRTEWWMAAGVLAIIASVGLVVFH